MPFAMPGSNDRIRSRIARSESEQVRRTELRVRIAALRTRHAEELRKDIEHSANELERMTGEFLIDMEDTVRDRAPQLPFEEWDPAFCEALRYREVAREMLLRASCGR